MAQVVIDRIGAKAVGQRFASDGAMRPALTFVYVLRSVPSPTRYYVGLTSDVRSRLETHNSGGSQHTAALRPWELVASIEFASESSAAVFEKYLKSGSGRAFAKRHFI